MTSSTSRQGSRVNYCPIAWYIQAKQYTLLDRLSDAAKVKTQPCDDAMIVDEPVKPVAGLSKHPDDMDVIDGELIY